MKLEERGLRLLWPAGQVLPVVMVLAMMPGFWSQMHHHHPAQAFSVTHPVWFLSGIWAFWSLGGLMWLQKVNKERMANN